MKTQLILLIVLYCFVSPLQAQKPFAELGLDNEVEVITLSNGRYIEHVENDTLRQIGSVMFNMNTNKIEYFIPEDDLEKVRIANRDREVSRFMAVDPLAAQYPHNSPYAFSENVVIHAVELEGLEKLELSSTLKHVDFNTKTHTKLSVGFYYDLNTKTLTIAADIHKFRDDGGGKFTVVANTKSTGAVNFNTGNFAMSNEKREAIDDISTKSQNLIFTPDNLIDITKFMQWVDGTGLVDVFEMIDESLPLEAKEHLGAINNQSAEIFKQLLVNLELSLKSNDMKGTVSVGLPSFEFEFKRVEEDGKMVDKLFVNKATYGANVRKDYQNGGKSSSMGTITFIYHDQEAKDDE